MTQEEIRHLKDALQFLYLYNNSEDFRQEVDRTVLSGGISWYKNKPLLFHVFTLIIYSPTYARFYRQLNRKSFRIRSFFQRPSTIIQQFLIVCYRLGLGEYQRLNTLTEGSGQKMLSMEDLIRIRQAEAQASTPATSLVFTQLVQRFTKKQGEYYKAKREIYKNLLSKIGKYKQELKTKAGRRALLQDPTTGFTAREIKFILRNGLIEGADKVPALSDLDPNRFVKNGVFDEEIWKDAVFDTAEDILEEEIDQSGAWKGQTASQVGQQIQSSLPALRSTISSVFSKFTQTLSPKAKNLLSSGAIQLKAALGKVWAATGNTIKSVGGTLLGNGTQLVARAGGAALQLGLRGAFAAGSTFTSSAVTGTFIILGVLLLLFLSTIIFNNLNQSNSMLFLTNIAEGAPLASVTPGGSSPAPIPIGGGDIANCTFYRGGDSTPGLQFRISQWPGLINEVASKVGIPSSVLAAVLRVERPAAFYSDNPAFITNDYDATYNGLVYGVMQFYPPTFGGIFSSNRSEMASLFGKTSVKTTIDPQSSMAPADVLRIYSVRDSLIAAAFKIRAKAGTNSPYDRATIDRIITDYFTRCTYTQEGGGTFNYCDDVWNSYSQCVPPTPTPSATPTPGVSPPGTLAKFSCPLEGGMITCASYGERYLGVPAPAFGDACGVATETVGSYQSRQIGGHCGPVYRQSEPGICNQGDAVLIGQNGQLIRTAKAIDVSSSTGLSANLPVKLPTINGRSVKWTYLGVVSGTLNPSTWGIARAFKSERIDPAGIWVVQFTHVYSDRPNLTVGQQLNSGETAAVIYPMADGPHVHTTVGLNVSDSEALTSYSSDPGWVFADRQLRMCLN